MLVKMKNFPPKSEWRNDRKKVTHGKCFRPKLLRTRAGEAREFEGTNISETVEVVKKTAYGVKVVTNWFDKEVWIDSYLV